MNDASIVAADQNHCIARRSSLVAIVLRGDFDDRTAEACYTAVQRLASEYPGGASVLVVIEPSASTPSPEARNRTAETMRKVADDVSGWAVVVEGRSLRPTMVRSILVALNMMSRSRLAMKYFDTVAAAAKWLAAQDGALVKAPQASDLAEMARSKIRP